VAENLYKDLTDTNWLTAYLEQDIVVSGPDEWRQLADITADAFQNDPVNRWIFGNIGAIRSMFGLMARHIYTRRGICHRIGDDAAAMWMFSNRPKSVSLGVMLKFSILIAMKSGPRAVGRAIAFDRAMRDHTPNVPHLYLFTVGVRQGAQGKGLGKRLLMPVLKACDEKGLPAYLENSNPENHGFYAGLGFEHVEMIVPEPGAPPLEAMWREPATSQGKAG